MSNGHAIIRAAALALAISGCGRADDEPTDLPSEEPHRAAFLQAEGRAIAMSSPRGHIVSVWDDGRVEHTGDSRFFMGIALRDFSCAGGALVRDALLDDLEANGWRMRRHPENPKPIALDPFLALWRGIVARVDRCPDELDLWRAAFPRIVVENAEGFDVVRDAVAFRLGLGAAPGATRVGAVGHLVAAWAWGVKKAQAAAYRIHLGYLALSTLEASGVEISGSREAFCSAVDGADMPQIDHWCGRGNLAAWADTFQVNAWEYRHQRAAWESPDGKPGLSTPALDYIAALREVYAPMPLVSYNSRTDFPHQ